MLLFLFAETLSLVPIRNGQKRLPRKRRKHIDLLLSLSRLLTQVEFRTLRKYIFKLSVITSHEVDFGQRNRLPSSLLNEFNLVSYRLVSRQLSTQENSTSDINTIVFAVIPNISMLSRKEYICCILIIILIFCIACSSLDASENRVSYRKKIDV